MISLFRHACSFGFSRWKGSVISCATDLVVLQVSQLRNGEGMLNQLVRTTVMKPFFHSNGEIALNKAFFWYRESEEIEILNETTQATPYPTNPHARLSWGSVKWSCCCSDYSTAGRAGN